MMGLISNSRHFFRGALLFCMDKSLQKKKLKYHINHTVWLTHGLETEASESTIVESAVKAFS